MCRYWLLVLFSFLTATSSSSRITDSTKFFTHSHFLGPLPWKQKGGLIVDGVIFDAGVAFRVWAPNADSNSAYVVPKSSTSWSRTLMTKNSTDGTYYVNIGNAAPGDQYVYEFTYKGGSPFQRLDPRAQGIKDVSLSSPDVDNFEYKYEHGGMSVRNVKGPQVGAWNTTWSASVVHDPDFDWSGAPIISPQKTKLIVYEMHVQTFNPSNGIGTLDSAINRLDHLASIGVNAVELLPLAAFSGSTSGWGYNPCAPFAVLNAVGGYSALKRFVKAANTRGIAVLLDIVWNHMDGGSNILDQYDGTGIYFYTNAPYANTPWGPRPNYDSPQVYQYILDSISMWISEYHISGFRWDSTVCIRVAGDPCYNGNTNIVNGWKLMQDGNNLSRKSPTGWTTAEDTKDYKDITKATSDTSAGIPGAPGGAGFDDQWEETYYYTLEPGLVLANNGQLDASSISKMIAVNDNEDPNRVIYTENHDKASNQQQGRIPKIVDSAGSPANPSFWALKKSLMGIGLELTNSGVPMLFYGQEFLTYAAFDFPVPPNLNWSLATSNQGVVSYVTDLAALKLNKDGTTAGLIGDNTKILQLVNDGTNKVIVYDRYSGNSHVVVLANMYQTNYTSFTVTGLPADGVWHIRFNGDNKKYSSQFGSFGLNQTSVTASGGQASLMIPQYSILVLSQ